MQPNPTPEGGPTPVPEAKPWQDSLPKALAEDPLFRGYKTVDDLAQAHAHLTKLKGVPANELLRIPTKTQDQAPEDWKPIYAALGVPADVKDYKIELAAEAATDAPALEGVLRELGGKANLNQAGMNAVVETLNTLGKAAAEADAAALAATTKETTETLTKEWGAAAEGNRRAIGKLIRDAMGGQIDEQAAADLETSLASNLTLSRVLAHAIGKMAEPETPGGGGALPEAPQLTPKAATAALNAFYGDADKMAALNNRNHPQHKAVLAERAGLLAQQNGEKRPDQPG
ncbi:hypothetical protein ACETK8_15805 [Brevundimonas staleyi]|uniref:Uncharacterized protein n=1 Tax=Brevundimonas staleyi TaxID=74326 RepID=A0ABW0FXM0_9CAUL